MKEFFITSMPDNFWFDLEDIEDLEDLYSDLQTNYRISFEEDTLLLQMLQEEFSKDRKLILESKDLQTNKKIFNSLKLDESFILRGSGIYATENNRFNLLKGTKIAQIYGTSIKNEEGMAVPAKNLHILSLSNNQLLKNETIIGAIDLKEASFQEACLRFVATNYSYNSIATFKKEVLELSPKILQNDTQIKELIESNFDWRQITQTKTTGVSMPSPSFAEKMKAITIAGARRGTIGTVNRRFVRAVTDKLGDACPDVLKTAVGQKMLEGMLPGLMLFLIEYDTSGRIPKAELMKQIAEAAWEDWAGDSMSQVIEFALDFVGPFLEDYQSAAASMQIVEDVEEADFETVGNLSRARVAEKAL